MQIQDLESRDLFILGTTSYRATDMHNADGDLMALNLETSQFAAFLPTTEVEPFTKEANFINFTNRITGEEW